MFSAHLRDAGTLAASESVLGKRRRDEEEDDDEDKENQLPKQGSEWDFSDDDPPVSDDPISPVPILWRPKGKRYVQCIWVGCVLHIDASKRRPRVLAREESFGVNALFIHVGFHLSDFGADRHHRVGLIF